MKARTRMSAGGILAWGIPLAAGHLRQREQEQEQHDHMHVHGHAHPQHQNHHHHAHSHAHRHLTDVFEGDLNPEYAAADTLQGDYAGDHPGMQGDYPPDFQSDYRPSHADVFDSCLVMCYSDMVGRWSVEFAEQMKADGFHFEACEDDDTNTEDGERNLGATNLPQRMWNRADYRGPDGKLHIPYLIKDTTWFDQETLDTIQSALNHIEASTGVLKFVQLYQHQAYPTQEYIYFNYEQRYEGYCASNIGRQANYRTNVYLGWCKDARHRGNVIHEILHALGFWHEHSRPDRDEHVSIAWQHVRSTAQNNFKKATAVNSMGSPFDFSSIMMYPARAFSTSYEDTIVPIDDLEDWETMGQRAQLSKHDVEQLRLLYQCASGPRGTGGGGLDALSKDELCSDDCPCWEHALGECSSDAQCMGDLVCGDAPNPLPVPSYEDQLPYYPHGSGQILCNEYCHVNCCGYANAIVQCPETCNSAPPTRVVLGHERPAKMCQVAGSGGGTAATTTSTSTTTTSTTTTSTTTTSTTTTSTTTSTTTTTPPPTSSPSSSPTAAPSSKPTNAPTVTSNIGKYYVNWDIDECVHYQGGEIKGNDSPLFEDTLDDCCATHLDHKYDECMGVTDAPTTAPPSPAPTETPKAPPAPDTPAPSANPTDAPTSAPPTDAPTPREIQIGGDASFYYHWETNKCVRNCVGESPCTDRTKHPSEKGHKTVQECCGYIMPNVPVESCTDADIRWYAAEGTCVNDGNEPEGHKRRYNNRNKCCRRHFRKTIMDCMGMGGKFGRDDKDGGGS